jgi:hypothetical protein
MKKEEGMRRDVERHTIRSGRRFRSFVVITAAVVCLELLTGACSGGLKGPGVAGGSSDTPGQPSPSPSASDPRTAALAYSRCMRAHGITDFPDPDANGGIALQGGPGNDLDPNNPRFKAADDACKSLLPPPPTEEQPQDRAQMLRYARCMREHGFPSFPDPKPGQGIDIDIGKHPELDPNNPRYQAANKACGGPNGSNTQSATQGGASGRGQSGGTDSL